MQHPTVFRNESLLALTDNDLKRMCPAIFATSAREDVSSRYGFVSTQTMVGAMREAGFVPTQVSSYMKRDPMNAEFAKHMVRFRKQGESVKKLTVGDVVPQIVLVNSHDRSSQFELFMGLWRLVCSNGMLASEGNKVEPVIIRHTKSAIDGLIDATGNMIKQQKFVFEHVEQMRNTELSEAQALDFAVRTLALRPERAGVIDPAQLLQVRRPADGGLSLWNVYNRAQENMTRGGLKGVTGANRAVVTRGITAINGDLQLNSGMWRIAMEAIEKARASSAAPAPKAARKAAAVPATA